MYDRANPAYALVIASAIFPASYHTITAANGTSTIKVSGFQIENSVSHLWVGSNLPIELRENTYLVLSPAYEQWQLDMADAEMAFPTLHGLSLPVALLLPFGQSDWSLTLMPVLRSNGEELVRRPHLPVADEQLSPRQRRIPPPEDAQVSLFQDYYLTEHLCLTLEAGYGFLRQLRTGIDDRHYLAEPDWGDGVLVRVRGAYRVRW